jgi:recombination protein RecT
MSTDVITLVDAQREQFGKVVAVKGIEFERERGFALQVYEANQYFRTIASENPQSFANAIVNVAAIGITLNPAAKLAYLVPRKRAICLDLSYMGLMHIAQECGAIQWGQARIVREKDTFELNGLDQQPRHVFKPFDVERGKIVGVYVVVKTDGGDYLTHTMSIGQVNDIRDRSEAWRAFLKDSTKKCPWNTDEEEMIKKTCVKQAAKYWPRRERLDNAVHHLNTEGGEGVTLTPNKMPDAEFEAFKDAILNTDTKEAAKAKWQEALAICKGLDDVVSADKLKAIMLQHATVLDEAAASAAKEKAAA